MAAPAIDAKVLPKIIPNAAVATTLTIASGVITPTQAVHGVDTEGAAASDDLLTIVGSAFKVGDELMIYAANAARTVVCKASGGNLVLPSDISLDDAQKTIKVRWGGSAWNYVAGAAVATSSAADISVTPTGNLASTDVQDALEELQTDINALVAGGVADGSVTNAKLATNAVTQEKVADDAVGNAELVNMAQATVKGRAAGAGTGDPTDLTQTQLTALINPFTSGLSGAVPASGGSPTTFLNGAGGFTTPSGTVSGSEIPIDTITSGNYTLAASDAGREKRWAPAGSGFSTFTVPSNASVPINVGSIIFLAASGSSGGIQLVTDGGAAVIRNAASNATGNRTINAGGKAAIMKETTDEWSFIGSGVA